MTGNGLSVKNTFFLCVGLCTIRTAKISVTCFFTLIPRTYPVKIVCTKQYVVSLLNKNISQPFFIQSNALLTRTYHIIRALRQEHLFPRGAVIQNREDAKTKATPCIVPACIVPYKR